MKIIYSIWFPVLLFLSCETKHDDLNSFEGVITYKVTVSNKSNPARAEHAQKSLGDTLRIYFKNGNYKMVHNGNDIQYITYLNSTNHQYAFRKNIDSIYVDDSGIEIDELQHSVEEENTDTILGKICNSIVFEFEPRKVTYLYSNELYMHQDLFSKHKFGRVDLYYSKSHAPYLQWQSESKHYIITYAAIEINSMRVEDSIFNIPDLPVTSFNLKKNN